MWTLVWTEGNGKIALERIEKKNEAIRFVQMLVEEEKISIHTIFIFPPNTAWDFIDYEDALIELENEENEN